MYLKKTFRTTPLTDAETLKHRLAVAQAEGKWACECCGFEEDSVISWTPAKGGDIRLSCLECHPYEDPWRYEQDIAVAWMPLHSIAKVSYLVRLIALTQKIDLGRWAFDHATITKDANPELQVLLDAVLVASCKRDGKDVAQFKSECAAGHDKGSDKRLADPLAGPLQKALKEAVLNVGADIALGVEAAELAFEGLNTSDILSAMELGPGADRDLMASGVRFIPKTFSSTRMANWVTPSQMVRDAFLSALIEVSKLKRSYVPDTGAEAASDTSVQPQVEDAPADTEINDAPETPEPAPRSLRSLFSIFRTSGDKA